MHPRALETPRLPLTPPGVPPYVLLCTIVPTASSLLEINEDPISPTAVTQRRCFRSARSPSNESIGCLAAPGYFLEPSPRPLSVLFTSSPGFVIFPYPCLTHSHLFDTPSTSTTVSPISWRESENQVVSLPAPGVPSLPGLLCALETPSFLSSLPSPYASPSLCWHLGEQDSSLPRTRDTLEVWVAGACL